MSTFQAGFRLIMNVPLFKKGEIIGALLLRSFKPHAYADKDVRLVERVGNQIAGAIVNAQLFTEVKKTELSLRESETRFRALVEQAAVGVAEIDMTHGPFVHGEPSTLRDGRKNGGRNAGRHFPGDHASGGSPSA